jgi:N-acetyl-1-D-myo-inositol-2-amino-2-deoxy-alpha-D-glucopyranoside deacetylase
MTSTRRSLLAVFAHPDDEVLYGGVLADCAARGIRVTLATVTMGDAGRVHDAALEPVDDLGALRAQELQLACERLGIEPPRLLGFHDSGRGARVRRDDPRALVGVDRLEVVRAIVDVIADVRPQVVITHDPLGGYDHPDHQIAHHATTAAFFAAGALGADAPVRLLYGATSGEAFRHFAETLRGRGVADGLDPDLFGMAPSMIALDFDARPFATQKLAAFAAHRSQFGLTPETVNHPPPGRPTIIRSAFAPMLDREIYLLGATRAAIPRWPLADVFDGIDARR